MWLALTLSLFSLNDPGSWTRFRGAEGAGRASDARTYPALLDREKGLAWSNALPAGSSSPCVTGELVIVTGARGQELVTVALERASGKLAWERAVTAPALEKTHEIHGPAAPTPTSDGAVVVSYFGSFGLVAHDLAGEELWRRELAVPKNTFGSAASPVIVDKKLVFLHDADEGSFLEALDPVTGDSLWRQARTDFKSGWSTPGTRVVDGRTELLVLGVNELTAYDLSSGSERWAYPGLTDEPITTPITAGGLVLATSYNLRTNTDAMSLWSWEQVLVEHDLDGDGALDRAEAEKNASVLSRPDADGEGDHPLTLFWRFLDVDRDGKIVASEYPKLEQWVESWEHLNGVVALRPGEKGPELAWHYPRGVPECPSPLCLDGRLYMVMNGGTVTCLDAASGALVFQERLPARGPYYASLVAADGKLYAASARGELSVFAADKELRVLSTLDLEDRLMATPALADGVVYVRTESRLWAFRTPD
jgi:outer membrane protein assembly factor BamB